MPAPSIDEIELADQPAGWSRLGFALSGDTCQIGSVRVRLTGAAAASGESGIVGWSLRDLAGAELDGAELDGLPTTRSESPPRAPAPAHPNGVLAIDHVVAFSPDLDRTVAAVQAAGLDLRRVREQPTPAGAPRQAFFRLGREILEVVQEPEGVVASPSRDDAPRRGSAAVGRTGPRASGASRCSSRTSTAPPSVRAPPRRDTSGGPTRQAHRHGPPLGRPRRAARADEPRRAPPPAGGRASHRAGGDAPMSQERLERRR